MLRDKVEALHRSSERMMRVLAAPRDRLWWRHMRREAWLHIRRSLELLWLILWRKNGES